MYGGCMKPIVYPYSMASGGARDLARALDTRRVWPDRNYRHRPNHLIINWGSSTWPAWHRDAGVVSWLNSPHKVRVAAHKELSFQALMDYEVSIPRFTTNKEVASSWETPVMVRHLLSSHSGRGCEYVESPTVLPDAPLYVEYIKKATELRVHVMKMPDGTYDCIDYRQKKVRQGSEGNNFQIRSYANGWVFTREGVQVSPRAQALAMSALMALQLDFAAVDIIHNAHRNEYYVLEVNTAPGLQGSTLDNYVHSIRRYL